MSNHSTGRATDAIDLRVIMNHVNAHRENHGAGHVQWSNKCARRAQDLVNRDTAGLLSRIGIAPEHAFGENVALGVEMANSTGACLQAFDMWQVGGPISAKGLG